MWNQTALHFLRGTPPSGSRWVQSRVERERLLKLQAIESCGLERVENQVPATLGDRARNHEEAMLTEKIVAKGLLARARNSRNQPIGVRHVAGFNGIDLGD